MTRTLDLRIQSERARAEANRLRVLVDGGTAADPRELDRLQDAAQACQRAVDVAAAATVQEA